MPRAYRDSPSSLRPPALRDNRIQLERSTPKELTISISDVVLSDEGEYTCSLFTMPVRTAKALVTVLGKPPPRRPPVPPAPAVHPAVPLGRSLPASSSSPRPCVSRGWQHAHG